MKCYAEGMQRFFLEPEDFNNGHIEIRDPQVIHQMRRVLRMNPGESFVALDNHGGDFLCELDGINDSRVHAKILEERKNTAEPEIFVTLYQALPKKMELFEWVLQKGTEMGISRFVPMVTQRTERTSMSKRERLEKILKEAAEQSERGKIPELEEAQKFHEVLAKADGKQKILLHGRGNHPLLSKINTQQTSVDILVGPEGGFTEQEIEDAGKNGFTIGSLGKRILRTETAGIVAASLMLL